MNRRPSRIVVAVARWALMAGLAGIVLAGLALVDRLRAPENLDSRHNLLVIAAILLSLSFVLAPFVRRAFDVTIVPPRQRERRKTLLDEMRERPEGEWADVARSPDPAPLPPAQRSPLTRLLLLAYLVFGATLIGVLFALQ